MANLSVYRGDWQPITVTASESGSAVNLTGIQSVKFLAKNELEDTDEQAVIVKTLGQGITVTDARKGKMKVELEAADTADVMADALYYTLKVVDSYNKPRTVANGRLNLIRTAIKAM